MSAHDDTHIKEQGVEALHRDWLAVEATGTWVDVAYRLLLGREPEPDAQFGAWRRLAVHAGSRRELIREIVASREFAEAALIEQLVTAVDRGERWWPLLAGHPDTTERVVEVPWVLSQYRGERRVLDIGTRHASDVYVTGLLRACESADVVGLDLVMQRVRGVLGVAGDLCDLPLAGQSIDFAACVSTIEHVGLDNSRYGSRDRAGSTIAALTELARVLSDGGRLVVTVPVGAAEDHGWFQQFDHAQWQDLVARAGLHLVEEDVFALGTAGWERREARAVATVRYGTPGPAAGAVLCSVLTRRASR